MNYCNTVFFVAKLFHSANCYLRAFLEEKTHNENEIKKHKRRLFKNWTQFKFTHKNWRFFKEIFSRDNFFIKIQSGNFVRCNSSAKLSINLFIPRLIATFKLPSHFFGT